MNKAGILRDKAMDDKLLFTLPIMINNITFIIEIKMLLEKFEYYYFLQPNQEWILAPQRFLLFMHYKSHKCVIFFSFMYAFIWR